MSEQNPWDGLSRYFDTSRNKDEIPSGAADNILIAWPVVLAGIHKHFPKAHHLEIIEFGCGGGGFAHKLHSVGHHVVGIDSSAEMVEVARKAYGKDIPFFTGDSSLLLQREPVQVITSIMTLQFIKDIETTFMHFAKAVQPNGLLVFAVFNPRYVVNCLKAKQFFEGFDSESNPKKGIVRFGDGIQIPTYIRTAREYTQLAQKHGLDLLSEAYPPFTKDFLAQYPQDIPTNDSEYLILGYRKK